MSERQISRSVTAQFLVPGWGTDEDFQRRLRLEKLLGAALGAAGVGECDGGDGGSGTMNANMFVTDPAAARAVILRVLAENGYADDTVVHYSATDEETGDEIEESVWWPEDYPYRYGLFGPEWKGPLPDDQLARLPADLRAIQGEWNDARYDAPDGSQLDGLRFLIVGDRVTIRRGAGVISDGRVRLDPDARPKHLDMHPLIGPNKGGVSLGVYDLAGGVFRFCSAAPGDPRPTTLRPEPEHQPGRFVLRRDKS